MRKLLIVDDEKNIRLGLKAMIEREFPEAYFYVLACDGEEALQEIRDEAADIVITDIRMPGMDGIRLINRLHESEHKPAVLVLSGYDDFAYAKEAIRCEVKDYLLKPIVREELFRSLRKLEKELSQKEAFTNQLAATVRQKEAYEQSQFGYILLHPGISADEIRDKLAQTGLQWMHEGFTLGLLRFHGRSPNTSKADVAAAAEALFDNISEEYRGQAVRAFDKEDRLAIAAGNPALFERLAELLSEPRHLAFNLGVSRRMVRMENLKTAYDEAERSLKYTFLEPSSVVRFDSILHRSTEYTVPTDTIKRLANMLGSGRDQEMRRLLYETLDIKMVNENEIGYLEAVSRTLNELVFDKVFHVYGEESVLILKLYKKVGDMYQFRRFHDYVHTLESLLERLNEYIKAMKSVHIDHREMRNAVEYIKANYQRDLNMATVSNHVSLNYSYFSQAFKEYAGISFVQYIKTVRMEKAKELLERTELKVLEIATRVGFENPKQFNRVFKDMEGVTPLEYRMLKSIMS